MNLKLSCSTHSEHLSAGNATSHSAAGERRPSRACVCVVGERRGHPGAGEPEFGRAGREGGLLRAGRGRVERRRGVQVGQQRPHRPDQQVRDALEVLTLLLCLEKQIDFR